MQSLMKMLRMMMMTVALMSFLSSAQADQSLACQNNFTHSVMCVWNTSATNIHPAVWPETRCMLKITIKNKNRKMETQMLADPEQPQIRRASVVFNSRKPLISVAVLQQEVCCESYRNPVVKVEEVVQDSVVKVSPPQTLSIIGSTVSWNFSSAKQYEFEVQYRSAAQSWTDVGKLLTMDTKLHLPEDQLQLQQQYSIRLRVKLQLQRAVWSDWSPEHTWTSTVGMQPFTPTTAGVEIVLADWFSLTGMLLTAVTLTLIIAFTLHFRCSRHKRNHLSYIPDPSKFFGDLNSSHGGNFKAWLGPVLLRESFITADSELVSPVEVLRLQDACDSLSAHTHAHSGPMDGWDKSSKSSNFSNSTYFLSQSSRGPGDALEPCSTHFSYGPAGGISGLETQRSPHDGGVPDQQEDLQQLERLRQDTQSPDSGFAGGAEDSMEESELSSPLPITLLPLELPVPQPIILPPLLGFSCTTALLRPLELLNTCGPVLPSSGDYRPVKSLQNNHCTD